MNQPSTHPHITYTHTHGYVKNMPTHAVDCFLCVGDWVLILPTEMLVMFNSRDDRVYLYMS